MQELLHIFLRTAQNFAPLSKSFNGPPQLEKRLADKTATANKGQKTRLDSPRKSWCSPNSRKRTQKLLIR